MDKTTNEEEIIDSTNDTDTTENDTQETEGQETDSQETESIEDLKKKIQTLEHQKEHFKKKAEKVVDTKSEPTKSNELSTIDVIALSKSNIDTEDIEDVIEYAKFKKISVAEAIKSNVVKTILADKMEMRKVASATNTGSTRRNNALTDAQIISNADKGNLPKDTDDEAIAKLARARLLSKKG